jgi:hypothetical protein
MNYRNIRIYEDIMLDPSIRSLEEKMVLNAVMQFQSVGKCFFGSDEYLAGVIGSTPQKARAVVALLAGRGRLRIRYADNSSARLLSIPTESGVDPCEPQIDDVFQIVEDTEV